VKNADFLTRPQVALMVKKGKSLKERITAVKQYGKFQARPNHDFDEEGKKAKIDVKTTDAVRTYICERCDKARVDKASFRWTTSAGVMTICPPCAKTLIDREAQEKLLKQSIKDGHVIERKD